jgi:hypothetical protein
MLLVDTKIFKKRMSDRGPRIKTHEDRFRGNEVESVIYLQNGEGDDDKNYA